jgi:predicted ATPase
VRQLRREPAAVHALGEELLAVSRDRGFAYFYTIGLNFTGWAAAVRGDTTRGLDAMREGARLTLDLAHRIGLGHRSHFTESLIEAGALDEAAASVERWLSHVDDTGEASFLAELHRLRGEILVRRARPAEAQAEFTIALTVATEQGARLFALRAAMALARLSASTGDGEEARARLAAIHATFTEGHDLPDLRAARRLLQPPGPSGG